MVFLAQNTVLHKMKLQFSTFMCIQVLLW